MARFTRRHPALLDSLLKQMLTLVKVCLAGATPQADVPRRPILRLLWAELTASWPGMVRRTTRSG